MSNYLNKVKHIIAEKAGMDPSEVTEDLYFQDDLNIDEMELMEIIAEIEEALHVDLTDEKDEIESVGDLLEALSEKLD
jgi:acyl carrier protein